MKRFSRYRGILRGLCTVLLLMTLTGCATFLHEDPQQEAQEQRNVQIAEQLGRSFTDIPGVARITDITYQDVFAKTGAMAVSLLVAGEADIDPTLDEVVRRIWVGDLDPLDSIYASATDVDDSLRGATRTYSPSLPEDSHLLEQRYGPRPR